MKSIFATGILKTMHSNTLPLIHINYYIPAAEHWYFIGIIPVITLLYLQRECYLITWCERFSGIDYNTG